MAEVGGEMVGEVEINKANDRAEDTRLEILLKVMHFEIHIARSTSYTS